MSSTGVKNQNAGIRVAIDQSRVRQTPKTDFGNVMKTGLSRGADAVVNAGALAAPYIPGGAVVSAAITGMGQLKSSASGQGSMATAPNGSSLNLAGGVGGGGTAGMSSNMDAIATRAQGGDGQAQMMMATREMQEMNMSFNLQYLQLQQKMQSDNRQFTLMSNIMKTKHDTAKNAINNVR